MKNNCSIKSRMKKVKGYLVWVMVFYTVLVTCFLLQSAWNEGLTVEKRLHHGNDKLLNVLFQEEKRHLRSFKDVIKTYGDAVQLKIRQKLYQDSKEADITPNKTETDNGDIVGRNQSKTYIDGRVRELINEKAVMENAINVLNNENAISKKKYIHGTDNIFIEDVVPNSFDNHLLNNTGDKIVLNSLDSQSLENVNHPSSNNIISIVNKRLNSRKSDNINIIDPKTRVGSYAKQSKLVFLSNKTKNKLSNRSRNNLTSVNFVHPENRGTEHCDKLDAEENHLCLQERVTYSHIRHINLTTNHVSFKPLGDLFVYSGFSDTRQRPAFLRFMVLAPRGRDRIKNSKYWCVFSFAMVGDSQKQNSLKNGSVLSKSKNETAPTQLSYYAASVGHNKLFQFYIMSCPVPDNYVLILSKSFTTRIYLVVGTKTLPNLDSVKEYISVDVVNNQGVYPQDNIHYPHSNRTVANIQPTLSNQTNKNALLSNFSENQPHVSGNNLKEGIKNVQPKTLISAGSAKQINNFKMPKSSSSSSSSTLFKPNSIVSCVSPMAESINVLQMVEFIELTLLLGSQHIVMYTLHVSSDVTDVLAMYRSKGLITVFPWTIPVSNSSSVWANGRDIALNDCLYRTMHRYEFVLIHDMDEYFVPRETPDLPSFINFLHFKGGSKVAKATDFVFSSAYFVPPTNQQLKSLASVSGYTKDITKFTCLRSVHRTYFNSNHSLRMVRPASAFRVGAGERKRTTFTISPRFAAVNHYSKCVETNNSNNKNNDDSDINNLCSNTKTDMLLWRIKQRLIRNSKQSIQEVNANRRR